ncbi:MAG: hypothetical protein AB8B71_17725 [Paracoccaceae bacterium]
MQPDFYLVGGLILAALAIPSIISALSDRRPPRMSAILVVVAGSTIIYALQTQPGGYTFSEIPDAFVRVFAEIING